MINCRFIREVSHPDGDVTLIRAGMLPAIPQYGTIIRFLENLPMAVSHVVMDEGVCSYIEVHLGIDNTLYKASRDKFNVYVNKLIVKGWHS